MMVQAISATPFNVITSPEVSAMRLGPIRLRSASSVVVIEAITAALVDRNEQVQLRTQSLMYGGSESYTIRLERTPPFQIPGQPIISDRSDLVGTYSIAALVNAPLDYPEAKALSREEVTAAIEAVLRLVSSSSPPKILIHPETGLLVVQGRTEHLKLAEQVIEQLKQDLTQTRQIERVLAEQKQRQKHMEESRQQQETLIRAELANLGNQQADLKRQLEILRVDTNSSSNDVKEAIDEVQQRLAKVRDQQRSLEDQLRQLRLGELNTGPQFWMLNEEIGKLRREVDALKSQRGQSTQSK